jgi:hypothetical protein
MTTAQFDSLLGEIMEDRLGVGSEEQAIDAILKAISSLPSGSLERRRRVNGLSAVLAKGPDRFVDALLAMGEREFAP